MRKLLVAILAFVSSLFGSDAVAQAMRPEERVKAFIADFHRAHSQLMSEKPKDQFERWGQLVETLDRAHFIDHAGRELSGVIDGTSPHMLKGEPIVSTRRVGERVYVETHFDEIYLRKFYEYELREVNPEDWRIQRLREFRHPPDAPFMTAKYRPRFDNPKVQPLQKLSDEEAHVDGNKMFAAGKSIKLENGKESTVEVRTVGTLNVTTGILVAGDLGYDPGVLSPLWQRVPPGSYQVEVAVAFKRNAAMRVRFSDHEVVRWHPADMGDGGHGVGVDAGEVAVMDLAAIMTLAAREKDRAMDVYVRTGQRPNSRMLSLVGPNDVAIADSAWGDGRYPLYWGVDAHGAPVVLVVDFELLP